MKMTAKRKHMTIVSIMLLIAMIAVSFGPVHNVYAAATPSITYRTHVQTYGTLDWVSDGASSGTVGQSKRLEGIWIILENEPYSGSVQYQTYVQKIGWQDWTDEGEMAGTSGKKLRLEAVRIRLTGEMADYYDVWYRAYSQKFGWLGWTKNGEMAGTSGYAYRLESIQIELLPKDSSAPGNTANASRVNNTPRISYRTHVQTYGTQGWVSNGKSSGTTGQSKRLEGIWIKLNNKPYSGSIQYKTHVQTYGWQDWVNEGEMAGTSGQAKRLEAIRIRLTGDLANYFDVWYRVHSQHFGWLGWAKNGDISGTTGYGYRLEAIQIKLLPKGSSAPGSTANASHDKASETPEYSKTLLQLGMTEDEVKAKWGEPDSVSDIFTSQYGTYYTWFYSDESQVEFSDGKVSGFVMPTTYLTENSTENKTSLTIGMTKDEVEAQWGTPAIKGGLSIDQWGTGEDWLYSDGAQAYFYNDKLNSYSLPTTYTEEDSTSEKSALTVGMTKDEVEAQWGTPSTKEVSNSEYGTGEYWNYSDGAYAYFYNGTLDSYSLPAE
jgi:uncharacterized protein YjdB